jgi:hypothetical protein
VEDGYQWLQNHSLLNRDVDFDAFEEHLGLQVVHASPDQ